MCRLSNLFKKDFLYNIGEIINNKKILDRIILNKNNPRHKSFAYKVECQICKNIYIIRENNIKKTKGCIECSRINDRLICNARPDLKIYFQRSNLNYFYSKSIGSSLKLDFICPTCQSDKKIAINTLARAGLGCTNCSDKVSFGEKFFRNILDQLNINYIYQFKFDKSTFLNNKKYTPLYDFCIPNIKLLVEIDGEQHYSKKNYFNNDQYIKDNIKDEFANENGHQIIRIPYQSLNYYELFNEIKNRLHNYFNFETVIIADAIEYASRPLVKIFSEKWNEGKGVMQIVKETSYDKSVVLKYLKMSSDLGLSDYTIENSRIRGRKLSNYKRKKKILCIETNEIFDSCKDCSNMSYEKFGMKIGETSIRNNIEGYSKSAGGLHFKYA